MGQGAEGWVPEITQTQMLYVTPAKHLGAQGLSSLPACGLHVRNLYLGITS